MAGPANPEESNLEGSKTLSVGGLRAEWGDPVGSYQVVDGSAQHAPVAFRLTSVVAEKYHPIEQ
jgi:hypothetical protein